jgi:hypothetical protein
VTGEQARKLAALVLVVGGQQQPHKATFYGVIRWLTV